MDLSRCLAHICSDLFFVPRPYHTDPEESPEQGAVVEQGLQLISWVQQMEDRHNYWSEKSRADWHESHMESQGQPGTSGRTDDFK